MKIFLSWLAIALVAIHSPASPVSAAVKTTIKWKDVSLASGTAVKVSALASTNSPGKKSWSVKGACTLRAGTLTARQAGQCSVRLSIKKSGKFPAKSGSKTILITASVTVVSQPSSSLTTTTVRTIPLQSNMPDITPSTTPATIASSTTTPTISPASSTSSTTTTTTTIPIVLRSIGVGYRGDDNLTVTVNSFSKTETDGSYRYTFDYTLKNENSGTQIDEGTWKIFKSGGGGTPQYGSFGSLFYNGTRSRTYTFEVLKNLTHLYIAYHSDIFFADNPPANALVFAIP
jgi:hypothetical protein